MGRLVADTTQLVVVDLQAKLLPHIAEHESVIARSVRILQAAAVLGLPVTVTEQYPQGLGRTSPAVLEQAEGAARFEKTTFSVWQDATARDHLLARGRNQILLIGIESHVCVQQTALDLVGAGLKPVVLADAVGSRRPFDRDTSLARMRQAGVDVTTTEAAIFEMLDRCDTDVFKRILPIVR